MTELATADDVRRVLARQIAVGELRRGQRLGAERAEAVRVFMSKHGVPLNRLSTISYGKADSVADNKTKAGRAQNRRVVLIVMS